MSSEITQRRVVIVTGIVLIFIIGMILSILFEQPVVTIVILSIFVVYVFCVAWQVRIKPDSNVYVIPPNQIKILGYEMNEVRPPVETKV
jgi:hypothetical protein